MNIFTLNQLIQILFLMTLYPRNDASEEQIPRKINILNCAGEAWKYLSTQEKRELGLREVSSTSLGTDLYNRTSLFSFKYPFKT